MYHQYIFLEFTKMPDEPLFKKTKVPKPCWLILIEILLWIPSKIFCLSEQNEEVVSSKKDMDILIKQDDASYPCLWVLKECMFWFISKMYWLMKKILHLRGLVTFFYDVVTDILMTLKLWRNCHYHYAYASISMLTLSTISTWFGISRLIDIKGVGCLSLLLYPFYFIILVGVMKSGRKSWVHTLGSLNSKSAFSRCR